MQYRAARPQTEAWLYGVLATVGMAALACSPVGKDRAAASKDGHAVAAADDRPECPQDSVRSWSGDDRGKVIAIPTAGPTSNVPEYHDCQRLVSGTPPVVGPLVAIFAAEKLDSLFRSSRAVASSEFRVAAEILSYDADYGPLHIRKGFNCLRLSPGPGTWRASIQFMGEMEPDCSKSPAAGSTSFDLPVKSYHMPGAAYDDYPAVARWEWDEKGQHHAIGIKCGAGWCEVGTSGKSEQEPNAGEEPPPPWGRPPRARTGSGRSRAGMMHNTSWLAQRSWGTRFKVSGRESILTRIWIGQTSRPSGRDGASLRRSSSVRQIRATREN